MNNFMNFQLPANVKVFVFCAATIAGTTGFMACNREDDTLPAPVPKDPLVVKLEAIPEIAIDTDSVPNGRVATDQIPKENRVYQIFKITNGCSTASTSNAEVVPNAEIAVTSNYALVSQSVIPESVVKSTKNYTTFTVKPDQFNQYVKLTIDQTKGLIIYIRDRKYNGYKKMATVGSNSSTFKFLPTYRQEAMVVGCSGSSLESLQ